MLSKPYDHRDYFQSLFSCLQWCETGGWEGVCVRNNFLLSDEKAVWDQLQVCLPYTFILNVSVPFLSGMALFEVSFCSMFPDTFSECTSSLLWNVSCCFASFCSRPQTPVMLMHPNIYSLHYRDEQGRLWMVLKSRVGWELSLWVWAWLLQGWIRSQRSSGII